MQTLAYLIYTELAVYLNCTVIKSIFVDIPFPSQITLCISQIFMNIYEGIYLNIKLSL